MQPELIVLIVLAVLVVAGVLITVAARRRSQRLRERFGPEYDRAVQQAGGRRPAESELTARQRRVERLEIRPLDQDVRDEYARRWRDVQARFVDEPVESVRTADVLVVDVMRERGYPVEDFDQREADLSVEHPQVVERYRAARGISMAADRDQATTEDLRQAMVHYRALFEDLLDAGSAEEPEIVVDLRDEEIRRAEGGS
jgi:hypothetical protein